MSTSERKLVMGRYRHYKGREYIVTQWAIHTENMEHLIVYYPVDNKMGESYARPYQMFLEDVIVDGKKVPRFELIEEFEF